MEKHKFEIRPLKDSKSLAIFLGALRVGIIDHGSTHSIQAANAMVGMANAQMEKSGIPGEAGELLEMYTG